MEPPCSWGLELLVYSVEDLLVLHVLTVLNLLYSLGNAILMTVISSLFVALFLLFRCWSYFSQIRVFFGIGLDVLLLKDFRGLAKVVYGFGSQTVPTHHDRFGFVKDVVLCLAIMLQNE